MLKNVHIRISIADKDSSKIKFTIVCLDFLNQELSTYITLSKLSSTLRSIDLESTKSYPVLKYQNAFDMEAEWLLPIELAFWVFRYFKTEYEGIPVTNELLNFKRDYIETLIEENA